MSTPEARGASVQDFRFHRRRLALEAAVEAALALLDELDDSWAAVSRSVPSATRRGGKGFHATPLSLCAGVLDPDDAPDALAAPRAELGLGG